MQPRLISAASIMVAMPMHVPHLPDRGGAVSARFSGFDVVGGFAVMAAAARQGIEVINASPVGTGTNSMLVRSSLAAEGIRTVVAEVVGDTGVCLVLLEKDGHNTSVLSRGVESEPQLADLRALYLRDTDWLYLSGTDFAAAGAAGLLETWLREIPPQIKVALALTQSVQEIQPQVLESILGRVNLLTLNERESNITLRLVGQEGETIDETLSRLLNEDAIMVRRNGSKDCLVWGPKRQVFTVATFPAKPVDTTGVGDTHTGVLLASLVGGYSLSDAVLRANAAASIAVSRPGAASAPTAVEIDQMLVKLG